jgi:hypothetical protein
MSDTPEPNETPWTEEPWSFREFVEIQAEKFRNWSVRHRVLTALLVVFLIAIGIGLYTERPYYQPWQVQVWKYSGVVVIVVGLLCVLWKLLRHPSLKKVVGSVSMTVIVVSLVIWGPRIYSYNVLWLRHVTLNNVAITDWETEYERSLPLRGVYALTLESMNQQVRQPALPDFVRVGPGNTFGWTMAIEPKAGITWLDFNRIFSPIDEVITVPSGELSPTLARYRPTKVNFTIGEGLKFSRNTDACVRRTFGPLRMWSYEPGNVLYMPDDSGRMVQVVSLIKWEGLWKWFPWPAVPKFGGVQLIEQGETDIISRNLFGCGAWIPAEKVKDHAFLRGQNLVPYEVSRFAAESLRFQAGYFGPLPVSRQGDIRIPDMPADMNELPFVMFFKVGPNDPGKLYQYFALEPDDPEKQGLSASLLYPGDGIGPIYTRAHAALGEDLSGPTIVADKVRASRDTVQWDRFAPIEARPYIRKLPDKDGVVATRFLYMTTIVAYKKGIDGAPRQFTLDSVPNIVFYDARHKRAVWVDQHDPASWPKQLTDALGAVWAEK